MSYGTDQDDMFRVTAYDVDRTLRAATDPPTLWSCVRYWPKADIR